MTCLHRFGLPLLAWLLLVQPGRVAAQCACGGGDGSAEMQMMQAYEQEVMRYQKEVAEKEKEIVAEFDEDGNGKLLGKEKAKLAKYMHEVRQGKKPNPFASIRPIGMPATAQ